MDRGTCKLLLWAAELGIGKVVPISPRQRAGAVTRDYAASFPLSSLGGFRGAGLNIMYRNCLAHLSPKHRNYAR